MKRIAVFFVAILVVFSSCSKEETGFNRSSDINEIVLKVQAENYNSKGTYDADGKFTWATGDKIGVVMWEESNTGSTWTEPLSLSSGDGKTEASFSTIGRDVDAYDWGTVAFYPWNGWKDNEGSNYGDDGKLYIHLLESISYLNESSKPQHLIPVATTISNNQVDNIEFKQIAAGIQIPITNVPAKATKVSLTIPGKNITGWYAIELASIGTDAINASNGNDANTVSITFGQDDSVRDMTFVFPVPTLSFNSLTIKVYNGDSVIWQKTARNSTSFELGKGEILNMPSLTIPATKTISVGIISYITSELGSEGSDYLVRGWGGYDGEVDAALTATGNTENKALGDSYWSNAEQTFTMYTATLPIDITGFCLHYYKGSTDRWFNGNGNATSTHNKAYIFNYSGDRALYE